MRLVDELIYTAYRYIARIKIGGCRFNTKAMMILQIRKQLHVFGECFAVLVIKFMVEKSRFLVHRARYVRVIAEIAKQRGCATLI